MGRRDDDMEREFAFHAEREAMETSARQAALGLGRIDHWKEEARAQRPTAWLAAWGRDLRLALRGLRRAPAFATVAIVTLALGIGASTAVFSVVEAVVLRPLPFFQPQRMSYVWDADPRHPGSQMPLSYPDFLDLRQAPGLAGAAAFVVNDLPMTGVGAAAHVRAAAVSSNLFDVLGVQPALGRGFLPGEDRPGSLAGRDPAVLSDALARRKFGTPGAALGHPLTLDGRPYLVVGVAAAGFQFPLDDHEDIWVTVAPLQVSSNGPPLTAQRAAHWMQAVARLAPGASLAAVDGQLAAISSRLARQYPDSNQHTTARVQPILANYTAQTQPVLWVLLAAVGCVLLIACVNVAGLLLARAVRRRPEFALRAALGASRGAVLRQLTAESLVVGLAGAGAGLLLARGAIAALVRLGPGEIVRLGQTAINIPVLLFALGLGVATAMLFGLFPALELMRAESGAGLGGSMQKAARGLAGPAGWRRGLVAAQFALALAVLVGALLLVHSLGRVLGVAPGFVADNVLTATINIPDARYPKPGDQAAFFAKLIVRLNEQPGIVRAAAAMPMPLSGSNIGTGIDFPDHPLPQSERPSIRIGVVTPGYFATLGIPLERGRDFTAADRHGAPEVAIVNQAFVREFLAGRDPLRARVTPGLAAYPGPDAVRAIVGVVGDTRQSSLAKPAPPMVYMPQGQVPFDGLILAVRTRPGAETLAAGALRTVVRSLDADVPVFDLKPLPQQVASTLGPARFNAMLLGLFAVLALALAAIGLYAVMAQAVGQRRREIGIRVALGARRHAITRLVVREGLTMAAVGVGVGLALAAVIARGLAAVLGPDLYHTAAFDPLSFALAPAVLLALAWLACALPARRAAAADPVTALRLE